MAAVHGCFRGFVVPQGSIDEGEVAPAMTGGPLGAVQITHVFDCADATADYDQVLGYNFEVTDVLVLKTLGSVTTASAVVKNLTVSISTALTLALAVGGVTRSSSIDTTNSLVSAGGTLRVSVTKVLGNAACRIYVNGIRR